MNTRTYCWHLASLFPGAVGALALLLCQSGCKPKSSGDTDAASAKAELIPLTNMPAI